MAINEDILNNSVKAENQTKEKFKLVKNYEDGLNVLFLGNSITLHEIAPDIGWHLNCGMAASCIEKDYVHLVLKYLESRVKNVNYCISNVGNWERNYFDNKVILEYENAKQICPDITIIRLGENINLEKINEFPLKPYLEKFCKFFKGSKHTIITDLFWHHDKVVKDITEICNENGFLYCSIGDLGNDNDNKALGLFEHMGVALHPGDLGMQRIAERIIDKLKPLDLEKYC